MEMNYLRRKVYDLPLFDFAVKSLADKLTEWPRALLLDTTNKCNAKCIWCPNQKLTNLGVMDMNLYHKIIDDYAGRGGSIYFGTFGEPLMDKMLADKVEYLRKYPTIQKIRVLTNAFFLNKKIISTLIKNRVAIEISLDEFEKNTFEKVKKMSYDVVRKNIINLLEENGRAENPVHVNFRIKTLMSEEEALNHEFLKILSNHHCTIDLTPINDNIISNWAGRFDRDSFIYKFVPSSNGRKYNHKRFNLTNKAPCNNLWRRMVVYWDGSVVLCCADMFASSVLGNLKYNSIEEIWRGSVLRDLRNKMIERRRFEVSLCKNCDIHLSWHYLKEFYEHDEKPLQAKF